MLEFARNKYVSVWKGESGTIAAHGLLDDDIYGLEVRIVVDLSDMKIVSIEGKWNRWTTPACPRAIPELQVAVGTSVLEEGLAGKMGKGVGRKACRHFANILAECCHSIREAVQIMEFEEARKASPDLLFEDFVSGAKKPGAGRPAEGNDETPAARDGEEQSPPVKGGSGKTPRVDNSMNMSGGSVIDLHVHTSSASPCSSAPIEEIIVEAKRIGLDGICLTDHNYVWDREKVRALAEKYDFLLLRGNEITTDQGDMVVFGVEEDIRGIIGLEDLRRKVEKAGGFMIVAHPFRGFLTFGVGKLGLTPERAMARPLFKYVDAVEVLNGKVTEKENSFAREVAGGLGLPITGGSDAHEVGEVGLYATRFQGEIADEGDLIKALKAGLYEPVVFRADS